VTSIVACERRAAHRTKAGRPPVTVLSEKPLQQTTDFDSAGGDLAEEATMHEKTDVETMIAALDVGVTRSAQDTGMAALTPLHREVVSGLPRTADQEVRVLIAALLPVDVTP
jgi:hypothetical protein